MQLRAAIPYWLEDQTNGLSSRFRRLLAGLWEDLLGLDKRLNELDAEIAQIAETDPVAKRLQQLRGVGPMIATAMLATVGNATQFANGRQMAAALGLTPRQNSSGGKERLLGISKRGDAYLRMLLVHGARSMIRTAGQRRIGSANGSCALPIHGTRMSRQWHWQTKRAHCLGNDHERLGLPA
jgi:transposase